MTNAKRKVRLPSFIQAPVNFIVIVLTVLLSATLSPEINQAVKEGARLCFEAIIKGDTALKSSGNDPRVVLEQLIVRLIFIISAGESIDKA